MNDPEQPLSPAGPDEGNAGYRLVMVSVRGHKYLAGNTTVHPVDEVPAGVGTRFRTVSEVRRYVIRELTSLSSFYRVDIVDDTGDPVSRGTRSGPNGTGTTWTWVDLSRRD